MTRLSVLVAALAMLATPATARNFAVPTSNPAALVTVPDKWTTQEIAHGYSAKSPDGDVFFSIEYATGEKGVAKMMSDNDAWMADNKIKPTAAATKKDINLGGLDATIYSYQAKDENGDTIVDFVLFPAGNNRVVFLTLWASEEEREANKADIMAIQGSVKALK